MVVLFNSQPSETRTCIYKNKIKEEERKEDK
jgi:hypothetical protein